MPVSALHRQVASVALGAAAGHGFALGGGDALLAHGVITRPTQDVDLFTDQQHGVEAAAGAVEAALRAAGLRAERRDLSAGLDDVFPGMGEGLAEWIITAPGGEQMMLEMAYFDRSRDPVVMDIGPVLDLEDVAGGKICALAGRVEPRDYADTRPCSTASPPAHLISFARRLDPGLEGPDFADAGHRLDRLPDEAFTVTGLTKNDITVLRDRFASWPRTADTARESQLRSGHDASPDGPIAAPCHAPERQDPEIG